MTFGKNYIKISQSADFFPFMKYDIEYLLRVTERYLEEGRKCFQNKCYIASFIMYGSVLESFLLAMCFIYHEEVRKTKEYIKIRKKSKRKRGSFLELKLSQLIEISEELKWLPLKNKVEDIGIVEDWVKFVQETRNLVHPARWLKPGGYHRELPKILRKMPYRKYKKYAEICEETIEGISLLLASRVGKDLAKKLKSKRIIGGSQTKSRALRPGSGQGIN